MTAYFLPSRAQVDYRELCGTITTPAITDALERARVVGVLDAQGEWEMCRGADGGWIVLGDDGITMNRKPETTQDAARAAAAKAIEAGEV